MGEHVHPRDQLAHEEGQQHCEQDRLKTCGRDSVVALQQCVHAPNTNPKISRQATATAVGAGSGV